MIPLYGFLEGDTLGLLILAVPDETVASLAGKLQSAARLRVAERVDVVLVHRQRVLDPHSTLAANGIEALDRFDVRAAAGAPSVSLVRVTTLEELWSGEKSCVEILGQRILLVRTDEGVFACEDRCCHLGASLQPGTLVGNVLHCPLHDWQYDVRTGQGVNPARVCLKVFAVQVEGSDVYVDVPASP